MGRYGRQRLVTVTIAALFLLNVIPASEAEHAGPGGGWPAWVEDFSSTPPGLEFDCTWVFYTLCNKWVEYPDNVPSRYRTQSETAGVFGANAANYGVSDSTVYTTPRFYDPYMTASSVGSFHVKLRASANDTRSSTIYLTDSALVNGVTGQINYWESAIYVELSYNGDIIARTSSGWFRLGEYAPDEWVTIDIDFTGSTYDVCVNGDLAKAGMTHYRAATTVVDTVALYAGGSTWREADAHWDDLLYVPTNQNFCLDTASTTPTQDFWNFSGVGDLYSDADIRLAAVEAFLDCTKQVNAARGGLFYPFHGCPFTVAQWEADIRDQIADSAAEQENILPDVVRPTNVAPTEIPRPEARLEDLAGVSVAPFTLQSGPGLVAKVVPQTVPGPELPPVPVVRTVPGPDFKMVDRPEFVAEPVTLNTVEVPIDKNPVVPLRDHDFEMNWTVSMTAEKFIDMVMPVIPEMPSTTSSDAGIPGGPDTADEDAIRAVLPPGLFESQARGAAPLHPDVEVAPPVDSPDFPVWVQERNDLIDYLAQNWGVPDQRDMLLLPPVVFEIHTESRGEVKRTTAFPVVPTLINVDNNPTTGLLGFDIAVRISFTPLLNEVSFNVTRLAPWERNMPNVGSNLPNSTEPVPDAPWDSVPDATLGGPSPVSDVVNDAVSDARDAAEDATSKDVVVNDPYPGGIVPGSPLDLTAYAIVPMPSPWVVETALTKNPDQILVAAVGFTTQGTDAPASAAVTLAADSLLPLNPNSRITIRLDTQDALDNFTLLGGVADALLTGAEERDLRDTINELTDGAIDLDGLVPRLFPMPPGFSMDTIIDTTAYRTGYVYEANNATLASVSFQPPPDVFEIDVVLATQADANSVIRFEGETDSDVRVVFTTETNLLSKPTRDAVNVRADKFPQAVTITLHDDPYLPATEVNYEADHALGRLHVITGTHVVFPEDGPEWSAGAAPFLLEGNRVGTADDLFYLNVSDLPSSLQFHTDGGDIRLSTGGPIGRVAVLATSGASPAFVAGSDGLLYETTDTTSRLGLVLRGINGFSAITSEPVKTIRWDILGDRAFKVRMSLGDDITGQDLRAIFSNLPPTLMFATDAATLARLETSDQIRDIQAYFTDHSTQLEADIGILDLPKTIGAVFNFTSGQIAFDAETPIREVAATARLGTGASGLEAVRLRVKSLPSFNVEWSTGPSGSDVTFDAGGNGIGSLEFWGGGTSFLTFPSLVGTEHAYILEDAHPDAPFAVGAQIIGLKHVSVETSTTAYGFRAEHQRPEPLTLIIEQPGLSVFGIIDAVPAVVDVRVDLTPDDMRAVYEASSVIDRIAMWVTQGTMEAYVDVRLIPERIDLSLTNDGFGGMRADLRNQGRLGSATAQFRDPNNLFNTQWTRIYGRLEGLPEEVTIKVAEGRVYVDAGPGALNLVEAAVSNEPVLTMLPGEHVLLRGDGNGDTVIASARITDFMHVDAAFDDELRIRLENERPRPFIGVVDYPHLGVAGQVRIADLPAVVQVTSNLVDRHLYEASSIISRIDVYAQVGDLQAWLGIEDLPARVKILLNTTEDGMDGFVLSSSRVQEIRADLYSPEGLAGTAWSRVYAKIQGIPEVLSFTADATGAEFGTEHKLIALMEGAVSTTKSLSMLEGDHVYADMVGRECQSDECGAVEPALSFRLHSFEGARVSIKPNDLRARLETRDARPFLAYVATDDIQACLLLDPLPTVVDFKSDLVSDHVYDASGVIDKLELQASTKDINLYARILDLPKHMHIQHNTTDDGGEARIWMESVLRDVLLDAVAPAGFGGTEWKRVRLHVEDIPREVKVKWDATGMDFGTGWDEIGLIEVWAATTVFLSELSGDHLMYASACARDPKGDPTNGGTGNPIPCAKAASARITGLSAARFTMTPEDGMDARLETRDPRRFRIYFIDDDLVNRTAAQVVIDKLPAVISFTSDLDSRFIYEASDIVNTITLIAELRDSKGLTLLKGRLEDIPTRIEATIDFGATGGFAKLVTSSPVSLIELEVYASAGLGSSGFTRMVGRVRDLPSFLEARYAKSADDMSATFSTGGQGIGLVEMGLTNSGSLTVTIDNGAYFYRSGGIEVLGARIRGFTAATVSVLNEIVTASLTMQQAAPFEAVASLDGTNAYARIEDVPAQLAIRADAPRSVVYTASSAIESIVLYAEKPTTAGLAILRADVTTVPATMRFSLDEAQKVIHLDSSEAIGSILVQLRDPEELSGFKNAYAKIVHVPAHIRVSFGNTMQVDLAEGVDSIELKATSLGTYPIYAGQHAVVRKGKNLAGDDKLAVSVLVNDLKFVEFVSRTGYMLSEAKFRSSQSLTAHYEEVDFGGTPSVQHHLDMTNVPKEIKLQLIQGTKGTQGSLLYDASERVGGLDYAMIKTIDDYMQVSFDNLPSDLDVDWRFGTSTPWFIRYVSDAPTTVNFKMPTSLGPLEVNALVQNLQWSILQVPSLIPDVSIDVSVSLFPPSVNINLKLSWTFILGTDTDFIPNQAELKLGLFHSDDFDLALTLTGDLVAQDWLYEASLVVLIGTSPSVKFEIGTVGGHAFAQLCGGVYVRYSPLGVNANFPCLVKLGGTYP